MKIKIWDIVLVGIIGNLFIIYFILHYILKITIVIK